MRCPHKARRIQRHLTRYDQDMVMTARNTFFLFFLTPSWPYKYSLCLGASIFLHESISQSQSFPFAPLSSISLTHKSLSWTTITFYDLWLVPFSCVWTHFLLLLFFFSLSLMVSLFWIPIKLLLIQCFPVICRRKLRTSDEHFYSLCI